jgi:hypothetical protein
MKATLFAVGLNELLDFIGRNHITRKRLNEFTGKYSEEKCVSSDEADPHMEIDESGVEPWQPTLFTLCPLSFNPKCHGATT